MTEEWLDLYTRSGEKTGQIVRRGDSVPEGLLYPVCDVWLINKRGEVLIQRRSLQKPNWPGRWCCSAGGCVQHGETPLEAALRETQEELGITLDPTCGFLAFTDPGVAALHQVWIFRQAVPLETIVCQQEEVDAVCYVTPEALAQMILGGQEFVRVAYLPQLMALLNAPI